MNEKPFFPSLDKPGLTIVCFLCNWLELQLILTSNEVFWRPLLCLSQAS